MKREGRGEKRRDESLAHRTVRQKVGLRNRGKDRKKATGQKELCVIGKIRARLARSESDGKEQGRFGHRKVLESIGRTRGHAVNMTSKLPIINLVLNLTRSVFGQGQEL